jgi:hypothetical protein
MKRRKIMSKETFVLEGQAFWAHVNETNGLSGKYQLDISQLENEAVEKCLEVGFNVANKGDDRGNYVTVKSSYPPRLVDAKKNPLAAGTMIGNGSVVKVIVNSYDYNFKGKKGVGAGFKAVQVIDLVNYVSKEDDLFDTESGYVSKDGDFDEIEFGD